MGILLTKTTGLLSPIASLFGFLMNAIYEGLNFIGIQNIGLCIILFTFIIYMCMLPMQIKQQKFTRISAMMNPEIQAINKKYKDKKDNASMLRMQEETKLVYEKYGTSPMGGCLGSLIQLPFLFALWPVVQNIPAYVGKFKAAFNYYGLVDGIKKTEGYAKILKEFVKENAIAVNTKVFESKNAIIDVLYKLQDGTWDKLAEEFPKLTESIEQTQEYIKGFNYFPTSAFGINIAETPSSMLRAALEPFSIVGIIIAIAIPVLAGLSQWISIQISQKEMEAVNGKKKDDENDMARSMGMMTKVMPLMSVVFCYTMPVGLGLYWITSAVIRTVQQVFINKSLNKKTIEVIVKENVEKAAKKRAKKNVDGKTVSTMATTYTRKIEEKKREIIDEDIRKEEAEKKAKESVQSSTYVPGAKPGSLAARANMVSEYNKRSNK